MTQGSLWVVTATTRSPRWRGKPRRVVDEAVHGVARRPAAAVLQRLRQVPVVERQVGLHAAREQAVDEAFVEVQALGVPGAAAGGLHARPADREAVGVDPSAAIRSRSPQPVARGRRPPSPSLPSAMAPGRRQKRSQIDSPLLVRGSGPLDLEAAGRHAPDEVVGEALRGVEGLVRQARAGGRKEQEGRAEHGLMYFENAPTKVGALVRPENFGPEIAHPGASGGRP